MAGRSFDPRAVKICRDRILSPAARMRAGQRAIKENASNLPPLGRMPRGVPGASPDRRMRMALLAGSKWKPGRDLRIRFMGGNATVKQRIREHAVEWMKHANLNLVFDDSPDAEIRIGFDMNDGSWSYLGTDALGIPKNRPTMNYGWLTQTTRDDEYSRVVLHEFGHAFGCIHEHQHPTNGIPWDKDKVYAYYRQSDGWSKADVDTQLFARYSKTETNFSQFDAKSIMLYAIPEDLTIGNFSVGWNRVLSSMDREFIGRMYPKAEDQQVVELKVGAPAVQSAIGALGEEDTFMFRAPKTGRYEVGTTGSTDLVLMLLGPDSQTRLVADDDDSGPGLNPRIREILMPGRYWARVRHYSKKGKGKYGIAVKELKL